MITELLYSSVSHTGLRTNIFVVTAKKKNPKNDATVSTIEWKWFTLTFL